MPVVGSAQCSQKLTTRLQPCMQKDYGGNRAACMNEAVGHPAPAVCDHLWERCEGLRSLPLYQLVLSSLAGITSGRVMCLLRTPKEDGELSVATIGPMRMLKWFVVSLGEAKLSNSMDRLHLPLTHQWMVQAHALGIYLLDLCMSLNESPVLALKAG